jgi:hypothetical protein
MSRPVKISAFILAAVVMFLCGWAITYPGSDPKGMKYVFWKAGLYNMNASEATDAMVGDAYRDELVIGKTRTQLQKRFGPLISPADASPYLRGCYQNSAWSRRDVSFIANSAWMVVFDSDKSTELILVKGC